jgi:2-polyprenyl-6-methoxyphenol hydroxylase-like FAD-dependent oxidoreductase
MVLPKKLIGFTDAMVTGSLQRPPKDLTILLSSEWDPSLHSMLELQDDTQTAAIRILSTDPEITTWKPTAQVTLLGDAVHLMSPPEGVGAVTTLKDAYSLAKILAKDGVSTASVGAYEEAMRAYSKAAIQRTFAGEEDLQFQPPFEVCKSFEI